MQNISAPERKLPTSATNIINIIIIIIVINGIIKFYARIKNGPLKINNSPHLCKMSSR